MEGAGTVDRPTYTSDDGYPLLDVLVTVKATNWSVASTGAGPPPSAKLELPRLSRCSPEVQEGTGTLLAMQVSNSYVATSEDALEFRLLDVDTKVISRPSAEMNGKLLELFPALPLNCEISVVVGVAAPQTLAPLLTQVSYR